MARRKQVPAGGLFAPPPAPDSAKDGLAWGLELHRRVEPRDWPRELEARVPPEHRAVAEEYLRGIAQRMRNLRELARADGFTDLDAWRAWRKAGRKE